MGFAHSVSSPPQQVNMGMMGGSQNMNPMSMSMMPSVSGGMSRAPQMPGGSMPMSYEMIQNMLMRGGGVNGGLPNQ